MAPQESTLKRWTLPVRYAAMLCLTAVFFQLSMPAAHAEVPLLKRLFGGRKNAKAACRCQGCRSGKACTSCPPLPVRPPTPAPATPPTIRPPVTDSTDTTDSTDSVLPPATDQSDLQSLLDRPAPNFLSSRTPQFATRAEPGMISDNFGAAGGTITLNQINRCFTTAPGSYVTGSPGDEFATIDFMTGGGTLNSIGSGVDSNGDLQFDTFEVTGGVPSPSGPDAVAVHPNSDSGVTMFDGDHWVIVSNCDVETRTVPFVAAGPGMFVGQQKVAENTRPIPTDRLIFNYSWFQDVPLLPGGVTVHRFSPGFEKTFFDGLTSLELRAPMASTADSVQFFGDLDGGGTNSDFEMGDLQMVFKLLLWNTNDSALAAGVQMTLPTASDAVVLSTDDGSELLRIINQSIHIMPYVGGIVRPSKRWYAQGFLQVDVDVNSSPVLVRNQAININNPFSPGRLERIGSLQDTTFMYLDAGLVYRLYENNDRQAIIRGILPTVELHHNQALQTSDVVQSDDAVIGSPRTLSVTNAVGGATFLVGNNIDFTLGYSAPLTSQRFFSGEMRLLFNKNF